MTAEINLRGDELRLVRLSKIRAFRKPAPERVLPYLSACSPISGNNSRRDPIRLNVIRCEALCQKALLAPSERETARQRRTQA